MRILVVGAGALGGYFGGCLVRAGRDVTFLVRPRRAEQLAAGGLQITGPHGTFANPVRTMVTSTSKETFDLVLLAVKAYALAAAINDMAPAIGPATVILPVLNGMAHLETLSLRFGAGRVLGGMTPAAAALDAEGRVTLLLPDAELVFGELAGDGSERATAVCEALTVDGFRARLSDAIRHDMWEKWVIISTIAGIACLMRASIGDIIAAPGGQDAILRLFAEVRAVSTAAGFPPRREFLDQEMPFLSELGSPLKSSMLRDIERRRPTEGGHILGEMVAQARTHGVATPVLDLAYCHVAAYDIIRAREMAGHANTKR